nr:hypothetical protein [Tanacetum cinerariifolium]
WRSFAAIINKCLTRKRSGYDSFLYHTKSIDYAFLIWEDFVYQVEHKNQKKSNEMYYLRFTKVIIHHFMSKDPSIPRRNKINWHYVRDDSIFSTIKVVSRHQNTQQYDAMLPIELTNDEIRNTKAYKEYYAFATGEVAPKPKASARRKMSGSDTSIIPPIATTTPTTTFAVTPKLTAAAKGKQPAQAKSPSDPSEVARTVAQQLKIILRRSRQQTHISQPGDSGTDEGTDKNGDDDQDQEVAKHDDKDDTKESEDVDEEGKSDEEDDNEETRDEESFDPIPQTPESSEDEGDGEEDQGLRISKEERLNEEEKAEELYRDVNINQGRGIQATLDVEDSHVTLTPVHPDGQQESSSISSHFVTSMLNPPSDAGIESIFATASSSVKGQVKEQVSRILPRIEQSMNTQLEAEVLTRSSHSSRTSYAVAADLSEMELKKILIEKMEGNKSIQCLDEQRNLYKALVEAYEADKTILDYSRLIWRNSHSEEKTPTTGSKSRQVSASESAFAEESVQTTSQMDEPSYPVFETSADDQPIVQSSQHPEWFSQSKKPPTLDHDWNKTLPAVQGSTQTWISELAKQADSRSSFNEILDTPLDFSNFIMNQSRVDTLTPELLAGPTFELMKGSCTSLIELEYHLEEVYKAITDQLDWVNPEGQQYPHNLLQPLPLIPDNRGLRVIPFAHFINNDLEYLRGGASSRRYTTSVTKTKAADYGQIKWIEDLVPQTMWIQEPIDYDKHALWGVSHWGWKRQQFYGFAVNLEYALDVYSKRRIIAITNFKIMEWHSYKHLDWITVRRDDDKLYKFKEGDFKRLRLQDIKDMLLLLIQGKLSNLTVEERLTFNVSLKMLNLTKPDTYRSDLKRREAYTAYSNPRGCIYQNKDKKNRLMRIDELYKFSDRTLNGVRNALNDRLKGIRMQYLPQTIWRKGDKDRAAAMIQAIDKMLKTRRIMRSLKKFVGGRLYEGDFRMLQRTI